MPYADAVVPAWSKETDSFMNVNPQMGGINIGSWKSLEDTIRGRAGFCDKTYDIFTEQFEVDCVQSKFENGKKTKTIICDGDNTYKVDGQPGDVSDFNKCRNGISLTKKIVYLYKCKAKTKFNKN